MTHGVYAEVNELIALKRFVRTVRYQPEAKILRAGTHLSKLRGRGMDFAEVRNYQAGDEIRHMEWRVTARTGRPHVKLYQEERERPVVLVGDFNPSMIFGTRIAFKSVVAARLAAMIAWTAANQGDRVGGFLFSAEEHQEYLPRSREHGVLPMLSGLSYFTHQSQESLHQEPRQLSEVLIKLRRVAKPGSIIVLISDFYTLSNECLNHLSRIRLHNDILAYHVSDRLELIPPKPQIYAISDGEEEMILDTRLKSVQQHYQDYCLERIATVKDYCQKAQIQYVQVTAADDIPKVVFETFPRRKNG